MLRIDAGSTAPYCDGMSRRNFVQLAMTGMASLGLGDLLRAKAVSAAAGTPAKDTSVILIWLDGGPGHMDMYDMKPEAPAEYRGIWRPINTNVPGFEITELFPRQAKVADKFSIVRSLHHDTGDHFDGAHRMLTGRIGANGSNTAGKFPFIGAMACNVLGPRKSGMPAHVAVPYASSVGVRPGYFGANYIGQQYDPFETNGDPNSDGFRVNNLDLAGGMTIDRLSDRRAMLASFDAMRRQVDNSGVLDAVDRFDRDAYEMVTSPEARKAFDISQEDAKTRDLYGRTHWGQCTLLARRLVEAGSTFVSVHYGGWDHHWNLQSGYESVLPPVDAAVSGLFTDLAQRGLDKKVLVVLCGEFSRTPRMNDGGNGGAPMSMGTPGRDHWGNAMFCLLGGGGVKGGQIVGSTNRLGEAPLDRPIVPGDIHATIFHCLGVDPHLSFNDHSGRPITAIEQGEVIRELL
jgi:uncharacterized protein (DUF1501 family)